MVAKRKLENRNALITGASRGIGKAIATCFAEEGANLFICARNVEPLEKAATQIRRFGGKVVTHGADISNQKSVQEMVKHALKEFKQIDILVNNAGIHIGRKFVDYSLDEFDQVIKVNLYGLFHVTQAVLPGMIAHKRGKIINIASTAGKWGSKNQSAYNASKHAIVGLTRCIALEVGTFNISVNAICPSLVETEETPFFKERSEVLGISEEELRRNVIAQHSIGRLVQPEGVAHLALYLASDESDGMTAQSILLCGGYLMV